MRGIIDIAVLIIYLAMLAVAVTHKGTAEVINSIGTTFTRSIQVAAAG